MTNLTYRILSPEEHWTRCSRTHCRSQDPGIRLLPGVTKFNADHDLFLCDPHLEELYDLVFCKELEHEEAEATAGR